MAKSVLIVAFRDFWKLFFIKEKLIPTEVKIIYKGFVLKLKGSEALVKLLAHLRGKRLSQGILNLLGGLRSNLVRLRGVAWGTEWSGQS